MFYIAGNCTLKGANESNLVILRSMLCELPCSFQDCGSSQDILIKLHTPSTHATHPPTAANAQLIHQ